MYSTSNINKTSSRREIIDHVLSDLRELKREKSFNNIYAIDENISFFISSKSKIAYFYWLFRKAAKLDKHKLLELTDLPFPIWDQKMHLKLIELERRKFPGLVSPLVEKIFNFVNSNRKDSPLVLVDFGSGGMEIERQIIKKLLDSNFGRTIIFIGVDKSPVTHAIAKNNLKEFSGIIDIKEVININEDVLDEEIKFNAKRLKVILCQNDIFSLLKEFKTRKFDLIFHSLFKHHLSDEEKEKLDLVSSALSKNIIEFDGYKSWFHIAMPHTITGWHDPVFLNAAIFSDLRYFTRNEIKERKKSGWKLSLFKMGSYMLEKNNS